MLTLYLARHGQTVENAAGVLQGHLPGQLTDEGRQQAMALREHLRSLLPRIDELMASDLARAHETATVLQSLYGLPITPCALLRERDWGSLTGCIIKKAHFNPLPADVESETAMFDRARRLLRHLLAHYNGMTVLAVGHGLFNRCIQAVLLDTTIRDVPRMENAEVRKLTVDEQHCQDGKLRADVASDA